MPRPTLQFTVALAALSLGLGGCSLWASSDLSAPVAPAAPHPSSLPPSDAGGAWAVDPSDAPTPTWDPDPIRAGTQARTLVHRYAETVRKQDIATASGKYLTSQAATSLRDCLAATVDIDEAWATCTVDPATTVLLDAVDFPDASHATITLRLLEEGASTPSAPFTVSATLTGSGARLDVHRLAP